MAVISSKFEPENLNESGSNNSVLFENIKDVFWKATPDLRFTYISPADKLHRGFDTNELIGTSIMDSITIESANQIRPLVQERLALIQSGKKADSQIYEIEFICKDGSTIWYEVVSNPRYSADGNFIGFQGISRNVSERKRIEATIRDQDNMYRTAVNNAPIVLFQVNKAGKFILSEGKGLEKLGLKPGEVVGMSVFDVYKDFPEICHQTREALLGKMVQAKINVNGIIFEVIYNPLFDKKGKVTSLVGIATDITENAKILEALGVSEIRFRTLFESMAEGVALHEVVYNENNEIVNYRIVEVNQAYERHTGIKNETCKNKLATELYGTDIPPYLKEFTDVAVTGIPYNFETYFPPLKRHFKISVIRPGKDKFATVFEDITDQKSRERELKEKNEELERFTYTVSHDLKSPLVTIKGFIGMLEQDIKIEDAESVLDDLERIKYAADKMGDLLNDLLELSRVGRIINPPVKVSMSEIVNETIEFLAGIITNSKANISITCNLPDVKVDRRRFQEVWQNLIENAIKFAQPNTIPQLEIGCTKHYNEHIFYLKDNGIGVDPVYHEQIFGLFNKLENKSEGTGIGLALIKRIVEVHAGRIWIESEGRNKGSKICFTLPTTK